MHNCIIPRSLRLLRIQGLILQPQFLQPVNRHFPRIASCCPVLPRSLRLARIALIAPCPLVSTYYRMLSRIALPRSPRIAAYSFDRRVLPRIASIAQCLILPQSPHKASVPAACPYYSYCLDRLVLPSIAPYCLISPRCRQLADIDSNFKSCWSLRARGDLFHCG